MYTQVLIGALENFRPREYTRAEMTDVSAEMIEWDALKYICPYIENPIQDHSSENQILDTTPCYQHPTNISSAIIHLYLLVVAFTYLLSGGQLGTSTSPSSQNKLFESSIYARP